MLALAPPLATMKPASVLAIQLATLRAYLHSCLLLLGLQELLANANAPTIIPERIFIFFVLLFPHNLN